MSAALAIDPALASLAMPLPDAVALSRATGVPAAPPADASASLSNLLFLNIFQGIPGNTGSDLDGSAGTATDTDPGAGTGIPGLTSLLNLLPPATPEPPTAETPAATMPPEGGSDLPADGEELPVEVLLSMLPSPATAPVAPATGPPAAEPALDSLSPAVTTVGTAGTAQQTTATPVPDTSAALPAAAAAQTDGADHGSSLPQPGDDSAMTSLSAPETADDGMPDASLANDSSTRESGTAPGDFRARLQSLLAPTDRITLAGDALASSAGAAAPASGPSGALSPALGGPAAATPGGGSIFGNSLLPTLEPLADRTTWSQGLGERLLMMTEKGLQSATLRLQPEHLGPLEIRLRVDDGGATQVSFSALHPQTRDAIEQAIPRLRELFAEQGLSLAQASVDSGRSAFANRGFAAFHDGGFADPAETADSTPVQALLWRPRTEGLHRIDLLV